MKLREHNRNDLGRDLPKNNVTEFSVGTRLLLLTPTHLFWLISHKKQESLIRFSLTPWQFYMSKIKSLVRLSLTPSHLGKWWEYPSISQEKERPLFASPSLLNTFIWERQRVSFASLLLLHTLGNGGGISMRKTENHKYLTRERETLSRFLLAPSHFVFRLALCTLSL